MRLFVHSPNEFAKHIGVRPSLAAAKRLSAGDFCEHDFANRITQTQQPPTSLVSTRKLLRCSAAKYFDFFEADAENARHV